MTNNEVDNLYSYLEIQFDLLWLLKGKDFENDPDNPLERLADRNKSVFLYFVIANHLGHLVNSREANAFVKKFKHQRDKQQMYQYKSSIKTAGWFISTIVDGKKETTINPLFDYSNKPIPDNRSYKFTIHLNKN